MYKRTRPCITENKINDEITPQSDIKTLNFGAHYRCPQCNRSYTRKDNLNRHILQSCPFKKSAQNSEGNEEVLLSDSESIQSCDSFAIQEQYLLNTDGLELNDTKIATKNTKKFYEQQKTPKLGSEVFKCNYCNKSFTRNYTLQRHLRDRCKIKKQHDDEKEEIFQKLIEQMEEQNKMMEEQSKEIRQIKEENQKLKSKLNSINGDNNTMDCSKTTNKNVQNNTNNTINNIDNSQKIQNNIKLVAFGEEDLSYITNSICKQILHKGFRSVPVLIKYTHFNENKPEQHNVYISNMRDSHAMIYDGKQWKLMDRTEAVDQLIHDNKYYLVEKFEELFEELDPVTIKKFNRFVNQSENDEILNGLKRDIKYMLYNNKNIPEKTKKLLCEDDCELLEN
jgi:uncharacterized C2H2 Zn-finger protein